MRETTARAILILIIDQLVHHWYYNLNQNTNLRSGQFLKLFAELRMNQRRGRSTKTQLCQAGAAKTLIVSSATGCELWAGIAL